MPDPLDELFGRGPEKSDAKADFASLVEPGETILWTGAPRPSSVFVLALRTGLFGLIFTSFTLLWIVSVAHGGKNNWDHGKAVEPFAPYNVGIALIAGMWLLPPGLWLLTWPLRAWHKAKKTRYAVTDRRVLIVEPDWIRGVSVRRFRPSELRLMRLDERDDGSGNIIFEDLPRSNDAASHVGFLAIERACEVESLIQKTLISNSIVERLKRMQVWAIDKDEQIFRMSIIGRLMIFTTFVLLSLIVFCVVRIATLILVVMIEFPDKIVPILTTYANKMNLNARWGVFELVSLGAAQFAFGVFALWGLIRWVTTNPTTIVLNRSGEAIFRSLLRTIVVRAEDVDSIVAGSWFNPDRTYIVIRHKGGKISLTNHYPTFSEFVLKMKYFNPSIRVRGISLL
jgi:hypothetical protein